MLKTNLVRFSELLFMAEKMGYNWNGAHDILVNDRILPMDEINSMTHHIEDFQDGDEEYDYSEDTKKIMMAFFKKENIDEFTLIND